MSAQIKFVEILNKEVIEVDRAGGYLLRVHARNIDGRIASTITHISKGLWDDENFDLDDLLLGQITKGMKLREYG